MAEMNESQEIIKDGGRLPIYVLLDTSGSMAGSVDELKSLLKCIIEQLVNYNQLCEIAALCAVTFDSTVKTLIPLSRPWDIPEDFQITAATGGSKSLGMALTAIRDMAKQDLNFVAKGGFAPDYKPLLVILTDGRMNTGASVNHNKDIAAQLEEGIRAIKSFPWGNVLVCGKGDYDYIGLSLLSLSADGQIVEIDGIKKSFELIQSEMKDKIRAVKPEKPFTDRSWRLTESKNPSNPFSRK